MGSISKAVAAGFVLLYTDARSIFCNVWNYQTWESITRIYRQSLKHTAVFVSLPDTHSTEDVCKPQNSWDITDFEYLCFLALFHRARFVCWLCFLIPYFLFQGQIFSYMEFPFLTALKSGFLLMAVFLGIVLDSLFIL